jgi:porin
MVSLYADAGLNWFAPLPGRPDDVAGIAVSYTQFGSAFRQSTGTDGVGAHETTVELTYQAKINRWLTMQADAQVLFNPAVNPKSGSREAACVLGMRAVINF